jgi:hypothetical protein
MYERTFLPACIYACLYICSKLRLSSLCVCLTVLLPCQCVCLPSCLCSHRVPVACASAHLFDCLSVRLPACLLDCLPLRLPVCAHTCLNVCLLTCLCVLSMDPGTDKIFVANSSVFRLVFFNISQLMARIKIFFKFAVKSIGINLEPLKGLSHERN